MKCGQKRRKARTVQRANEICDVGRIREGGQAGLGNGERRHWRDAKCRVWRKGSRCSTSLHGLSLVAQELSGQVGLKLGIVEKTDVVESSGPIEQLQRHLSGNLIGARQADHCKNTFDELAMNCCTEGYPRAEYKHIHP